MILGVNVFLVHVVEYLKKKKEKYCCFMNLVLLIYTGCTCIVCIVRACMNTVNGSFSYSSAHVCTQRCKVF